MIIINSYVFGQAYSAESLAVFAKMPNPLTDLEKTGIAAFVDTMVTDGNWSKLDYFYGFFLSDIDNACTSWVGTKTATRVNAPTHDSKGFLFNGSTQYLDSLITMSTDLVQASLNDNLTGAYNYSMDDTISIRTLYGYRDTSFRHGYWYYNIGSSLRPQANMNDTFASLYAGTFINKSDYSVGRTGTNMYQYKDNSVIATHAGIGAVPFPLQKLYIGAFNWVGAPSFFWDGKLSYFYIGSNTINKTAFNTALTNLKTYFGLDI